MRIRVKNDTPSIPRGVDLTLVPPSTDVVATFAAYVIGELTKPGGEKILRFGIPFDQIPNTQELMREVGGVLYEVTVRRVPFDQLPEPGW